MKHKLDHFTKTQFY